MKPTMKEYVDARLNLWDKFKYNLFILPAILTLIAIMVGLWQQYKQEHVLVEMSPLTLMIIIAIWVPSIFLRISATKKSTRLQEDYRREYESR